MATRRVHQGTARCLPAADINHNGLISPNGLGNYVTTRVESFTDGAQTPGMEIRYDTTVFAAGM